MKDLGTLGGSDYSQAQGINASGQVVGWFYLSPGSQVSHAFLYSDGKMTDLGSLGSSGVESDSAAGINASGQVVGSALQGQFNAAGYCVQQCVQKAFLYTVGTGMVDLNTFLPSGSGWTLQIADGINDAGQITGLGWNSSGAVHAFLLSPMTPARVVGAGTIAIPNSRSQAAFVFGAEQPNTGTATGNLVYFDPVNGDLLFGKINTLIVSGNTAYFSGICTGNEQCVFSVMATRDSFSISGAKVTAEAGHLTTGIIEMMLIHKREAD
jgi:probable HAF family extracellular repeat protein